MAHCWVPRAPEGAGRRERSVTVLLTRRNRVTPDPEDDRSGRGWGATQPSVLYGERWLVGDRGCEGLPEEARGGTRGHGD